MEQRFDIQGRLPGFNEYVNTNRSNRYVGNKMKRDATDMCSWAIREARLEPFDRPVEVGISWIEGRAPNSQLRDVDNIRTGAKFILDALVDCGIIPDDGPYWVRNVYDHYRFNANNPHIEVVVREYVPTMRTVVYEPTGGLEDMDGI